MAAESADIQLSCKSLRTCSTKAAGARLDQRRTAVIRRSILQNRGAIVLSIPEYLCCEARTMA